MAVSKQRVYGTTVFNGLRHIATGMIDGTFAKKKGEWDTNTRCGKYTASAVDEDEDLVVTCILCLGRRQHAGSILRGMTADVVHIDEAQDFTPTQMMDLINKVGEKVVAGATRRCVAEIPSSPPPPSDGEPRASRRSRSRG